MDNGLMRWAGEARAAADDGGLAHRWGIGRPVC